MQLVAATGNIDKLAEFTRILSPLGIETILLGTLGIVLCAEETGATFAENARIKALSIFNITGKPALADDSGLCVDALAGRPGVYSARYCGEDAPYSQKMASLLDEMKNVHLGQRGAKFVCTIVCVLSEKTILEVTGVCTGFIGFEPIGENGFGYDPLFMLGDRSFAQIDSTEKDKISHRGKALQKMAQKLSAHI